MENDVLICSCTVIVNGLYFATLRCMHIRYTMGERAAHHTQHF